MTPFIFAYITTLLWSSTDGDDTPLDRDYSASDLAPSALAIIEADCAAFEAQAGTIISDAIATGKVVCGPDFDEYGRAAHDFALTRNGHGAGFWDGDWPEPMAAQLTDIAHSFGEQSPYVGDDGKIYI